jgi:chromosome segregation ATPase
MNDIITVRDIDTITTEIKTIEMQMAKMAIHGCIEIGRRLVEAKEAVGHGGWGKYLEDKVRYSQQWATNLMNLYREYGNQQESLFESFANSKSFGNIDVTKHILLLSVPAEERAEFAETHDAEHSSVRELKEAIRDRDVNLQAANEQAARAEKAEAEVEKLTAAVVQQADMLQEADYQREQLQGQLKEAKERETEAAGKVDKLKAQLAKAKDGEKAAKAELEKAKANPEIPESLMEQMRSEVAADAAAKATADLQKQLDAAVAQAQEAEKRRLDAEAKVEAAEKRAQLANPDMVLVSTYLQGVQEQFNKMLGALKKIAISDPAAGAKLKENVKVKLIASLEKALED